jgi:hypothetical protein
MKVRRQRINARLTEPIGSSTSDRGIPGAIAVDVGRIIRTACRSFARAVDWQNGSHFVARHGEAGVEERRIGHKLSENHQGLHSGRYISVSVLGAANAVAIKGGYYDRHWQPKTVYRETVPFREVTAQGLGRLLMEMHNRLGRRAKAGEN